MIVQFDAIDHLDRNQWKLFSEIIGEDAYAQVLALSVKMYILEKQGISCDILSIEDYKP